MGRVRDFDRGYAWVIAVCASVIVGNVMGSFKSSGIVFAAILERYEAGVAVITWIPVMTVAMIFTLTFVSTALCSRFGARKVIVVASLISTLGFAVSSFCQTVPLLIVFAGFIPAIGNSLMMMVAIVIVPQYFVKRISLAAAIVVSGGSVGSMVLPRLYKLLVDTYDLHGTYLIFAGISLNMCVAGALICDPPDIQLCAKTEYADSRDIGENEAPLMTGAVDIVEKVVFLPKVHRTVSLPGNSASTPVRQTSQQQLGLSHPHLGTGGLLPPGSTERIHAALFSEPQMTMASLEGVDEKTQYNTGKDFSKGNDSLPDVNLRGQFRRFLSRWFDFELLKNPLSWIEVSTSLLFFTGYNSPFIFLQAYGHEKGLLEEEQVWLVPISGICDLIGRLMTGVIGDRRPVKHWRYAYLAFSQLLLGVATLLFPLAGSFPSVAVYCAVLGVFGGCVVGINTANILDLVGVHHFAHHLALRGLFIGPMLLGMAALNGAIRDWSESYDWVFRFCGISILLAGLLLLTSVSVIKARR